MVLSEDKQSDIRCQGEDSDHTETRDQHNSEIIKNKISYRTFVKIKLRIGGKMSNGGNIFHNKLNLSISDNYTYIFALRIDETHINFCKEPGCTAKFESQKKCVPMMTVQNVFLANGFGSKLENRYMKSDIVMNYILNLHKSHRSKNNMLFAKYNIVKFW